MAAARVSGVRDAAETATDAEGELEVARQVHGIYAALGTSLSHGQRVQRVAKHLVMPTADVRRYLALQLAPALIREMFRTGRLSARVVEALQGLKLDTQTSLVREIERGCAEALKGLREIEYEVDRTAHLKWSEQASSFERKLYQACALLDRFVDMPRGALVQIFQGAGGSVGRRSLIELIDRQISLLETMRGLLERVGGVAEPERPRSHEPSVASGS